MKDGTESFNHALTGLLILGGIGVAGLVLLMITEAGGGRNWPFNAFLLVAAATFVLYSRVVYRSQQHLRGRLLVTARD